MMDYCKNITTTICLENQKKNSSFENNLNILNINYIYKDNKYFLKNISNKNMFNLINILAWDILNISEKKKKEQMIEENYSSNFIGYVSKNPFIAIYIKDKLLEYFINNNSTLNIEKFIKFNLKDIDKEYDKLLEKIEFNQFNNVQYILRNVLFNDKRFKNVNEIIVKFESFKDIDDFNCDIITDTRLKINSLLIDSTISLYGLSQPLKNSSNALKNELNAVVATIIALTPKRVVFEGEYNNEIINNIMKKTIENNITNIEYITL